jgi:hypothetical protein
MENTYKYAILTAVPDPRRGERVNIGIVVIKESELDVRFQQAASKLKALTGSTFDSRIQSAGKRIKEFSSKAPVEEILSRINMVDPILSPTGTGIINVHSTADYERRIGEILTTLIVPPRERRTESQSRINTEIAKVFQEHKALAKPNTSITKGKIVRDYSVSPNEGLRADFALKNGKLHVASTLDLRKSNATLAEAALKSIVLDKATEVFGGNKGTGVRTIGVYAVAADMRQQFKQHIELLGDYADETYNWEDGRQHSKFLRAMYDALPDDPSGLRLGRHDHALSIGLSVRRKK